MGGNRAEEKQHGRKMTRCFSHEPSAFMFRCPRDDRWFRGQVVCRSRNEDCRWHRFFARFRRHCKATRMSERIPLLQIWTPMHKSTNAMKRSIPLAVWGEMRLVIFGA